MLQEEIFATLAYYDVHNMPLRAGEVFRYLIKKESSFPSRQEIEKELKAIPEREGYYYLFGREYLVPLRHKRAKLAWDKWRRTYRAMKWLRAVPFVRVIFASGSLALHNTEELSDLDILLVVKNGRIWFVRLGVLTILAVLGIRRKHTDRFAPDKICPNHFVTDASLKIPFQSVYTAQLYANLIPLVVTDRSLLKKFEIANEWVFHYLHHWQMEEGHIIARGLGDVARRFGEFFLAGRLGDFLENLARYFQKRRIEAHAVPLHPGGHLAYTNTQLAFHSDSSETELLLRYEQNMRKINVL
mgnify:CR=1 FL=1